MALAGAAITALLPPAGPRHAPDIAFALLDGRTLALGDLRGRPVLVNFWATTCRVCVAEMPDLVALYQELRPLGFELIAVAMPYDPPSHVQDFVRRHELPFPIALDVQGQATAAFNDVRYTPTAYLIDRTGEIVYHHTGRLDVERVRRLVLAMPTARS
ncbi:MAG: TlpA disulfide reductase family protein [Gammaproteobacteria bacterium]